MSQSPPTAPPAAPRARPVRDRFLAVVLAIAAILVAGIVVQAAGNLDDSDDRIYLDVALDQRARLTESGSGAVVDVRVGDRLVRQRELSGTAGRWVVVDLRTWAETARQPSIEVQLLWNGNSYDPVDRAFEFTPAGFTSITSSVFEVPADAVTEFTVVVGQVEIIRSHQHFLRLRMPLDPGRAEAAAGRTVTLTKPEIEVSR